jgi:zinc transport system permease protein
MSIIVILTAILIGLNFGAIGCIALWKRYIHFGDGFGHASLLIAVLSILFSMPIEYSGILFGAFFAILIFCIKKNFDGNTAISIISSSMLSLTLIILQKAQLI